MVFTISYKNVVLYQEIVSKCQVFFQYDSLYAGRCNDIHEKLLNAKFFFSMIACMLDDVMISRKSYIFSTSGGVFPIAL